MDYLTQEFAEETNNQIAQLITLTEELDLFPVEGAPPSNEENVEISVNQTESLPENQGNIDVKPEDSTEEAIEDDSYQFIDLEHVELKENHFRIFQIMQNMPQHEYSIEDVDSVLDKLKSGICPHYLRLFGRYRYIPPVYFTTEVKRFETGSVYIPNHFLLNLAENRGVLVNFQFIEKIPQQDYYIEIIGRVENSEAKLVQAFHIREITNSAIDFLEDIQAWTDHSGQKFIYRFITRTSESLEQ